MQKTAYEMRSSDWISDVCPADLWRHRAYQPRSLPRSAKRRGQRANAGRSCETDTQRRDRDGVGASLSRADRPDAAQDLGSDRGKRLVTGVGLRSEEHTSELQSLMRISYAVFCLKKKKKYTKEK